MDVLPEFSGATLDSRQVKPGMLFVAIKGEKTDGHAYIPQALAAGAAGIVDGREELARLARAYRRTLKATVIGVTGSAGKTTTKELTAAFLRAGGFKVHATAGNYNNDLGLPLTILNCPKDADFLVLEMGTNHPGEIAYLVDIAEPQTGLISSIGTAHIEFFKTQDGIADEKGTLFRRLARAPGNERPSFAVLARENDRYDRLAAMSAAPVVTVSQQDAEAAELTDALRVRLPGKHNVSNALIALACARAYGVDTAACLAALADFTLPGGRWRTVTRDGVTYVDDTYNANPTSMIAALETFAAIPAPRHVAVLGDMFELGERTTELHAEVGHRAGDLGLDALLCVGAAAAGIASAAAEKAPPERICHVPDRAAAADWMRNNVRPGDLVLLKASHGMRLDLLLEAHT